MNAEQLAKMYAKGYRYHLTLIGEPNVPPLCVKSVSDVGPLMREQYPTYRVLGQKINECGSLENTRAVHPRPQDTV